MAPEKIHDENLNPEFSYLNRWNLISIKYQTKMKSTNMFKLFGGEQKLILDGDSKLTSINSSNADVWSNLYEYYRADRINMLVNKEIEHAIDLHEWAKIVSEKCPIEEKEFYGIGKIAVYINGPIKYSTSKRFSWGRKYAKRVDNPIMTIQGANNNLKAFLTEGLIGDFDISNCHPTLMSQLLQLNEMGTSVHLDEYRNNRDAKIDEVKKFYNHPKLKVKQIKKLFCILVYGGTINTWREDLRENCGITLKKGSPKFVRDFQKSIKTLCEKVLASCEQIPALNQIVEHAARERERKKNQKIASGFPSGTVMSHILQILEDRILNIAMEYAVDERGHDGAIIALYDGAMMFNTVVDNGDEPDEEFNLLNNGDFHIQQVRDRVMNEIGIDVNFKIKPQDAYNPDKQLFLYIDSRDKEQKMVGTKVAEIPDEDRQLIERIRAGDIRDSFDPCILADIIGETNEETFEIRRKYFGNHYMFNINTNSLFFIRQLGENGETVFKTDVTKSFNSIGVFAHAETKDKFMKVYEDKHCSRDRVFVGFEFKPHAEIVTANNMINAKSKLLNKFTGYHSDAFYADKKPAIIENWLNVVYHQCECNPKIYNYVIDYFAHMITRPWAKAEVPVALVFIGCEGTGKGVMLKGLQRILNHYLTTIAKTSDVVGNFNTLLEDKICVVLNEATAISGKDSGAAAATLKGLISDDDTVINTKCKAQKVVKNYARFIITSNKTNAVNLDACSGERRFVICQPSTDLKEQYSKPQWKKIAGEIDEPEFAATLLDYFKGREIKTDFSKDRVITEQYKNVAARTFSSVGEQFALFIDTLKEESSKELAGGINVNAGLNQRGEQMNVYCKTIDGITYATKKSLTSAITSLTGAQSKMATLMDSIREICLDGNNCLYKDGKVPSSKFRGGERPRVLSFNLNKLHAHLVSIGAIARDELTPIDAEIMDDNEEEIANEDDELV